MTSWLMWDSVTPYSIPSRARVIAPYRNGDWAWDATQLATFGGAAKAYIDVLAIDPAGCAVLDVEKGNARAADVPGWLDAKPAGSGCVYCSRASLPAVVNAADGRPFFLWLATLDGSLPAVQERGVTLAAVQAWGADVLGFGADLSVIYSADWLTRIGGTP